MAEAKFKFFEVVRIHTRKPMFTHLVDREAVIGGMSQDERGRWSYAVFIYGEPHTLMLDEDELDATGKMDKRETFYSGKSITVKVDPDTGEGYLG